MVLCVFVVTFTFVVGYCSEVQKVPSESLVKSMVQMQVMPFSNGKKHLIYFDFLAIHFFLVLLFYNCVSNNLWVIDFIK